MLELKHPSAFELEAWTVGEQTAEVEKHVQSCAQCRSIVDTLEIDRQEFLEEEGPEEFLNRSPVAELIASQIKDNKERRRLESRAELSQGLPYDAERVSEPKPVANDNIISLNPKSWVWSGVLAIAASIMFVFFSPSMFDSKTENTFRLKGASQINIILERDSVQSKHTEEVQLQPKDQFQVQVVLAKPLTLTRVFVDDILLQAKDNWLKPLILGLAFAAVLRAGVTWLKEKYLLRLEMKLTVTHSARFIWHVFRLPIPFFLARFAGDISSRVSLNDRVAGLLAGRIAESALDFLMVFFYGALLFAYDPLLTIIGISISAINILVLKSMSKMRAEENMKLQQMSGKLQGVAMGGLQVIESLKATGAENDFYSKWSGYWAKLQNSAQELAVSTIVLSTVPVVLNAINTAAILTIGGLRVMDGVMTIGMLIAYQSLMASFVGPVNSLVSLGTSLQEMIADVTRLDDVLRHE